MFILVLCLSSWWRECIYRSHRSLDSCMNCNVAKEVSRNHTASLTVKWPRRSTGREAMGKGWGEGCCSPPVLEMFAICPANRWWFGQKYSGENVLNGSLGETCGYFSDVCLVKTALSILIWRSHMSFKCALWKSPIEILLKGFPQVARNFQKLFLQFLKKLLESCFKKQKTKTKAFCCPVQLADPGQKCENCTTEEDF